LRYCPRSAQTVSGAISQYLRDVTFSQVNIVPAIEGLIASQRIDREAVTALPENNIVCYSRSTVHQDVDQRRNSVVAAVGQVNAIILPHMDAVRPHKFALAPGPEKLAIAIECRERMFAAREHINLIAAIDPDGSDIAELPAIRQRSPIAPALGEPVTKSGVANSSI